MDDLGAGAVRHPPRAPSERWLRQAPFVVFGAGGNAIPGSRTLCQSLFAGAKRVIVYGAERSTGLSRGRVPRPRIYEVPER